MKQAKPRQIRLSPERRRAQLLECAIAACAQHGVARVTHSHVAKRAGVSVSAVYAYFRTRKDLVTAALSEVETFLGDCVFAAMAEQHASARSRFLRVAQTFAAATRDTPDLLKVWLDWSTGVESEHWPWYQEVLENIHKAYRKAISQGKRSGEIDSSLPPTMAARLFSGGGHTIALMHFAGSSKKDIDKFINHLVEGSLNLPPRAGA